MRGPVLGSVPGSRFSAREPPQSLGRPTEEKGLNKDIFLYKNYNKNKKRLATWRWSLGTAESDSRPLRMSRGEIEKLSATWNKAPDFIAADLLEAVRWVLSESKLKKTNS